MVIRLAPEAAIVLSLRLSWRCPRIALDGNLSALAIGQTTRHCRLVSLRKFLLVAARPMEFSVQFFRALAFFVNAPGMIG
jgi:hypothetical protein